MTRTAGRAATTSSYSITMRLHTAPDHGVVGAVATAMDHAFGSLAASLEECICSGLNVPHPASTILRLKLQALKTGASQQPVSDLDYARSVQDLSARVPNREAFEATLRRLQLRKWVLFF